MTQWTRQQRLELRQRLTAEHRRRRDTPRVVVAGPLGTMNVYEDPAPPRVVDLLRMVLSVTAEEPDGGEALARAILAWALPDVSLRADVDVAMLVEHRSGSRAGKLKRDPRLAAELWKLVRATETSR